MNFKQQAAAMAATFVKEKDVVGIGAGATMAFIAGILIEKNKAGFPLSFITSSYSTRQLFYGQNIPVLPMEAVKEVSIYFDGCDQFDHNLNALKSGGGIHTHEKLVAAMTMQFVLVGDDSKRVHEFDIKYPLVLEVLPQANLYVQHQLKLAFKDVTINQRISDKIDGAVLTQNGNYLLNIFFEQWPELSSINPLIKNITGVVETSLFYNMAHKAVIAGEHGVEVLER